MKDGDAYLGFNQRLQPAESVYRFHPSLDLRIYVGSAEINEIACGYILKGFIWAEYPEIDDAHKKILQVSEAFRDQIL